MSACNLDIRKECARRALASTLKYIRSVEVFGTATKSLRIVIMDAGGIVLAEAELGPEMRGIDLKERARQKARICLRTRMNLEKVLSPEWRDLKLEEHEKRLSPTLHAGGTFFQHKSGNVGIGVAGAGGKSEFFAAHAARAYDTAIGRVVLLDKAA